MKLIDCWVFFFLVYLINVEYFYIFLTPETACSWEISSIQSILGICLLCLFTVCWLFSKTYFTDSTYVCTVQYIQIWHIDTILMLL